MCKCVVSVRGSTRQQMILTLHQHLLGNIRWDRRKTPRLLPIQRRLSSTELLTGTEPGKRRCLLLWNRARTNFELNAKDATF